MSTASTALFIFAAGALFVSATLGVFYVFRHRNDNR